LHRLEELLESFIFSSRWLLAPFYLGLVLTIGLLLVRFINEFTHFVPVVFTGGNGAVITGLLGLIDLVLVVNLILIVVLAGYENFVSRIDTGASVDRPKWMGQVGFSELKMKLIGSIVAISAIELLKAFMYSENLTNQQLAWKVGIHMTFVTSGVLFAVMDRVAADKHNGHEEGNPHG